MNSYFYALRLYITRPHWSRKEESLAIRRLSLLIASGMSVPEGLQALTDEQRGGVRNGLNAMQTDIEGGASFTSAASAYPGLFSAFSIEVMRIGEESGSLAENLAFLSRELEKQARLRARLVGALIYPTLLALLTIALSGGLVLFVFPKVLPLFSGLGADLPLSTRMMLAISEYIRDWGLITLIISVITVVVVIILIRNTERLKDGALRAILRIPIIGGMLRAYRLGSISRCLGIMLSANASVPAALRSAGAASGNSLYERVLTNAAARTEEGTDVRNALAGIDAYLLPPLARDMLAAGEASGSLPEAAFHLAAYYEHEFDEASGKLSVLVEPVLMILMGLIVGFVAVSMILPIYSITSHLRT